MKSRLIYIGSVMIGLMAYILLAPVPGALAADARDKPLRQNTAPAADREKLSSTPGTSGNGSVVKLNSSDILMRVQDADWRLIGTAVIQEPGLSVAVIGLSDASRQGIYHEGDRISGMLIKKILDGKVVVGTDAGDELLISKSGYALMAQPSHTENGRIERQELEKAYPDYVSLMESIRFRPFFVGGKPNGFVIYNIQSGSVLDRLGIKNSDIVVSLNGQQFKTTQPVVEFYNALMDDPKLSIEVMREDEVRELRLEMI